MAQWLSLHASMQEAQVRFPGWRTKFTCGTVQPKKEERFILAQGLPVLGMTMIRSVPRKLPLARQGITGEKESH